MNTWPSEPPRDLLGLDVLRIDAHLPGDRARDPGARRRRRCDPPRDGERQGFLSPGALPAAAARMARSAWRVSRRSPRRRRPAGESVRRPRGPGHGLAARERAGSWSQAATTRAHPDGPATRGSRRPRGHGPGRGYNAPAARQPPVDGCAVSSPFGGKASARSKYLARRPSAQRRRQVLRACDGLVGGAWRRTVSSWSTRTQPDECAMCRSTSAPRPPRRRQP